MKNEVFKRTKDNGFTFVEVLITIVILGILSAIAIPLYLGQIEKSKRTEATTNLESVRLMLEQYFNENGCYYKTGSPSACADTTISGATSIQAFLPGFKPGNAQALKFNYFVTTSGGATAYIAAAVDKTVSSTISSGASCSGSEMKVDNNNNRCGF
ncbi:MAG: prepilin-type N-terminal cleavage/methylation domain-containing protein [Nitrospirae bacterium]|nr:prepilin-type N-terminal cleavage/methylation domain-containing protein [Nitrospirota bacterium]